MILRPTYPAILPPTFDALAEEQAWQGESGDGASLESQIIAAYAGAGWVVPFLFLARADTVDAASVGTWANLGTGSDATGAAKPAFGTSVLNGRPALSFDGTDILTTGNVDLSSYTAVACTALMQDADTGNSLVCEFTADAAAVDGGFILAVNNGSAGDLMFGQGTALGFVRSAASFTMATPGVITGTGDRTLATNENAIRHNKVDVSSAHTASNTAGGYANAALNIGARNGGSLSLTGDIAALVIAVGATAPPTAAIASVEQLLLSAWGL